MELDLGVICPLRIQKPFTLSKIYQVTILVRSDIAMFEPGELFQFLRVFARNPAGFVERHRVELHRCPVFVEQAVLYDLEL